MTFEENCESCGKSMDFRKWGPNRICPFCGNDTVTVDIKEVHIFFGEHHSQCFTEFIRDEAMDSVLKRNGKEFRRDIDYLYLRIFYELCMGNISNPPYSNAAYYAHTCGSFKNAQDRVEKQFGEIGKISRSVPVYLWLSDNEPNELMNLLYFAKRFACFDNLFLVRWEHTEEDFDGALHTMIAALEKKERLSLKDLNDFSARFDEIQSWNSECRMGNSEVIEPWPFSRLEEYVLATLTEDNYRKFGSIYSAALDAIKRDTSYHITFPMLQEVVHRLMLMGKIWCHGAYMWWGDPRYNNLIYDHEFCLFIPFERTYTELDIIKTVSNAFELGFTYPLFRLLDDDTVLEDGEQRVSGKWNVIEHIEVEGSYRANCCKEKVVCHLAQVEMGKDYRIGDIYILVRYEKDDDVESRLVKVLTDGNVIRHIEISDPKGGLCLSIIEGTE